MGILDNFEKFYNNLSELETRQLPLCAAENIMSPFARLPLSSFLQEKYIMGGVAKLYTKNNFLHSDNLFDIYKLLNEQCSKLYNSSYADARTLSGVNCVTTLLMSLFNIGDKILVCDEIYGGHTSMPLICRRLGLITIDMPYDFENNDFDYTGINKILNENNVKGILITLSDTIQQPSIDKINLNDEILIYDATQTLGLIAGKAIPNPINMISPSKNFLMIGATHKTLPGPTCGLILTRNAELANKFDLEINPNYLRNVQLNVVTSLLFTLYETELCGSEYSMQTINLANSLGAALEKRDIKVIKTNDNKYSHTHQLWISLSNSERSNFMRNASIYNINVNARNAQLYQGAGIRIGTQYIARCDWKENDMPLVAEIIYHAINSNTRSDNKLSKLFSKLPLRKIAYTVDDETYSKAFRLLHNS